MALRGSQETAFSDRGFLYNYDPATNIMDTLTNFYPPTWQFYKWDSLRGSSITHQYGWELTVGHDNRLYGFTVSFAYDPVTGQFEGLNNLRGGFTAASVQLGSGMMLARPLETCLKPYHFTTIPDTLYALNGQPFSFTISTPNTEAFNWTKNNSPIPPPDSILSFPAISLSDSGRYQCLLVNECGDSLIKSFYIKVSQVLSTNLTFTGKLQNNNAILQWKHEAANTISRYELQRSTTANNFTTIASMPSQFCA